MAELPWLMLKRMIGILPATPHDGWGSWVPSLDVTPRLASSRFPHCPKCNAQFRGNLLATPALVRLIPLPDNQDRLIGQRCSPVVDAPLVFVSSLFDHVIRILRRCPSPKMIGINTRTIIARVADARQVAWYTSMDDMVRNSMGKLLEKESISRMAWPSSNKWPARFFAARFVSERPKQLNVRWGKIASHFGLLRRVPWPWALTHRRAFRHLNYTSTGGD